MRTHSGQLLLFRGGAMSAVEVLHEELCVPEHCLVPSAHFAKGDPTEELAAAAEYLHAGQALQDWDDLRQLIYLHSPFAESFQVGYRLWDTIQWLDRVTA